MLKISALAMFIFNDSKNRLYHQQWVLRYMNHWCKWVKEVDPEWNLGEDLLKLISKMKFVHLKRPFGIYEIGNFQGYKVLLGFPLTLAYKASLHESLVLNLELNLVKKRNLRGGFQSNAFKSYYVNASHWFTQESDKESQTDKDLIVSPPTKS